MPKRNDKAKAKKKEPKKWKTKLPGSNETLKTGEKIQDIEEIKEMEELCIALGK